MTRFILWLNRCWHAYRDACQPHVALRAEWNLTKLDE